MERTKQESLPRNTNLSRDDFFRLLVNSPELVSVKDQASQNKIVCFIRSKDTNPNNLEHMYVLPPSSDRVLRSSMPTLQTVAEKMQAIHSIDTSDIIISPLFQEHHCGMEWAPFKLNRNQWVTLMVRYNTKASNWVATLIDPSFDVNAQLYGGMKPFERLLTQAFPQLKISLPVERVNLGVQDAMNADTNASGHWTLFSIQLLLGGTRVGGLFERMKSEKIERVIAANQSLYLLIPRVKPSCTEKNQPPIIPLSEESPEKEDSSHSASTSDCVGQTPTNSLDLTVGGQRPDSSTTLPEIFADLDEDGAHSDLGEHDVSDRESQFSLLLASNPVHQSNKPPSASMSLNGYALLFLGGGVVALIGVLCLFLAQTVIFPVLSTGLIVAGVLGMFAGAVGVSASQSLCGMPETPVNAV